MPIYEYQCDDCEIRIEKLCKMAASDDAIPCAQCGGDMRKLVSAANFAFNHPKSQLRGSLPPNTGTSDDFNFDKAIGRDAAEKWKTIDARNSDKDKVIQEERKKGLDVKREQLVASPDGKYRTITEPERVRANANRETAFKVAQAAKTKGKRKGKKEE